MTALEALEDIKDELWGHYNFKDISEYNKNQFALIEKELKAFEAIKKNLINIDDNDHYNSFGIFVSKANLIQEDYSLLKEELV